MSPPTEPLAYDPDGKEDLAKWRAKRRLASALRAAIDRLIALDVPEVELSAAAEQAERWVADWESYPRLRYELGRGPNAYAAGTSAYFDQSPMAGLANPLAPPMQMRTDGERRVSATATFGAAYEGPPGHVHGGYVAAAIDEILGYTQGLAGPAGMTRTLTVHYHSPTPLHTPLELEGEHLHTEGRRIYTRATVRAAERITAEAEGLFISLPQEHRDALAGLRASASWSSEPGE